MARWRWTPLGLLSAATCVGVGSQIGPRDASTPPATEAPHPQGSSAAAVSSDQRSRDEALAAWRATMDGVFERARHCPFARDRWHCEQDVCVAISIEEPPGVTPASLVDDLREELAWWGGLDEPYWPCKALHLHTSRRAPEGWARASKLFRGCLVAPAPGWSSESLYVPEDAPAICEQLKAEAERLNGTPR